MITLIRRTASGGPTTAVNAVTLSATSAGAQPAPPVADFFKLPAVEDLEMSPSGKRMFATVPRGNGRLTLVVIELEDLTKSRIVAGFSDADIWGAEWVNDDRIVFRIYDQNQPLAQQRGTGLFAVDAQGRLPPRELIIPSRSGVTEGRVASRSLLGNHALHSVVRDGSNDVIVAEYVWGNADLQHINLKRVDTVTGQARGISQSAPPGVRSWTVDAGGQPRFVTAYDGPKEMLYWKAGPAAEWVKIAEGDRYGDRHFATPFSIDANDRVYATARVGGATNALVVADMKVGLDKLQPLLESKEYDFTGSIVRNAKGEVLGVHYLTDARATYWFDAGMRKIQQQVDALLPSTNNRLDCGDCDNRERVLVRSDSDRQPPSFTLFDTRAGTLSKVIDARPWIDRRAMAPRDMVRIGARDGLPMPVHVTRPKGQQGPAPMVVLVHGGPWVRGGEWRWDAESQFLASRGYVVVEPEFRGSTGFGRTHFRAGWKQWGLAMQDDVADAALWAVKQGYADPKRICIAGASYGGYATLMGLIRNPEIFRCGVEWAGVTDIELMYSIHWSDLDDQWKSYGMPRLIGDREKDAAQLAATSPIRLASKVTQPLLMAYGGIDQRVPIEHGVRFRDAVRKTNPAVEWIDYPEEGHGWLLPANNIDFWGRVEKFLDKHLRNAPQ